jgi:DNA-binding transcriptional regulator YdaS (Cro superfamily)
MTFQDKLDELNAKSRQQDITEAEKTEAEARERAKKNDNFYMVFKDHAEKLRELIKVSPPAAQIFMFLAEQADRTNAVVASGKALAAHLQISEATVSRAIKLLTARTDEKEPYLEVIKSGGSNVFILNPDIVWSAWKTGKNSCLFGNAKVLVSTNEQDISVRKRLNVLLEKSEKQLELLPAAEKQQ